MIKVKGVTKRFKDGTTALKNINLTFRQGELTCIIGPSGCGKTTLLKHINRLITPTDGDIHISDTSIYDQDVVALRRSIGYVIQQVGLFPHMSILENITVVPKLLGWSKEKQKKRADEMLELVNLEPDVFRDRYPLELSGGQQQRVGVARALVGDPEIILMDEPFSALDPISREQLQDYLKNLHQQVKKTVIFVTHDMDEALKLADRIIIMRKGEVEQIGEPAEILKNPASDFVRTFIGKERMERFMPQAHLSLKHFKEWFVTDHDGETKEVSSSLPITELIDYFIKGHYQAVLVKENDEFIGYLTKDRLLEALASERGNAS